MRPDLGLGTVVLAQPFEGGSHPTLAWEPVSGASSYWLVVRDGDGEAYWAWSGSATSVRLGAGERAVLNQTAALDEEMSWTVMAFDQNNTLIALTDVSTVTP